MTYNSDDIIGKVVADNYRTASVFKKHQIDFCCNGNRSICDAVKPEDIMEVIASLNEASSSSSPADIPFEEWPIDLLANYIESIHHKFVKEKTPILLEFLRKIKTVHGERHPELFKVHELFEGAAAELEQHMQKEESILFPFARNLSSNNQESKPVFGTIQNLVAVMMQEHENEGERFRTIRELINDYKPPIDACTTYRVAFQMLEEFEEDLHKHIHLENNILFPKTVEMEELQMAKFGVITRSTLMSCSQVSSESTSLKG